MSAKTGVMPSQLSACAVPMKVNDGISTSPVRSSAWARSCRPAVALAVAMQYSTPASSATRLSNSFTSGPSFASQRLSRAPSIRSCSRARSPMFGRPTCSGAAKVGDPPSAARSPRPRGAWPRSVLNDEDVDNTGPTSLAGFDGMTNSGHTEPIAVIEQMSASSMLVEARIGEHLGVPATLGQLDSRGLVVSLPDDAITRFRVADAIALAGVLPIADASPVAVPHAICVAVAQHPRPDVRLQW